MPPSGISVLVVEGSAGGHPLEYARRVLQHCNELGVDTHFLTTHTARWSDQWMVFGLDGLDFRIHLTDEISLTEVCHLTREFGIIHVVVPNGNSMIYAIAKAARWRSQASISLLAIRGPDTARGWLRKRTKKILFSAVGSIRNVEVLELGSPGGRRNRRTVVDAGYLSTDWLAPAEWPEKVMLDAEKDWFLVAGVIEKRKNLSLVLEALAGLDAGRVGLLVAGVIASPGIERYKSDIERLRESNYRVVVVDRLLSESELDGAIAASDVLILAHGNEGPSGLLQKALLHQTRVLGAGAKSLRRDIEALGTGEWVHLDADSLTRGMERIRQRSPVATHVIGADEVAIRLLGVLSGG